MPITYSAAHVTSPSGTWTTGNISSAATAVTTGQLVVVMWTCGTNASGSVGTLSISNTGSVGAGLTWTLIGQNSSPSTGNNAKVVAWYAVAARNENITVTVNNTGWQDLGRRLTTIVHSGAHATTPVRSFSTAESQATSASVTITPLQSGSAMWMLAGDYTAANSATAGTNCSLEGSVFNSTGDFTTAVIRPTTQPRTDSAAFTLSLSGTSATWAYIAFEVQAAGSSQSQAPRSMHQLRQRFAQ
ncbi:hypothetical protein [Azohydromonas lata]|uniref:hypothetical protein n=1 Tax=Azohydromonas lata TaxID=45677 RepID=UPI000833B406|nr:hypothetical protein [Azohydromonas lata]